jgi:guanine nucleotide-binding protein G(I)/G(S)/G(T) subunit beta-1
MLWDVELGQSKLTFSDHEGDVMSVSILPSVDPNMFISGMLGIDALEYMCF